MKQTTQGVAIIIILQNPNKLWILVPIKYLKSLCGQQIFAKSGVLIGSLQVLPIQVNSQV